MLRFKAPFRIAAHLLPDLRRHGDLFVELPGRETLLTFEFDGVLLDLLREDFSGIYLVLSDRSLEPLLKKEYSVVDPGRVFDSVTGGTIHRVPLRKKADHRGMYMTYSGRVETKGFLHDFLRGKLDGFAFDGVDYLLVVNR